MDEIRIEFRTIASSYGLGPYHPAIRRGVNCKYWPNVTFPTEDQAFDFAAKALKDAYDAAASVAREWYIRDA